STNESAAARAQLRSAEYAALDPRWMPASDPAAAGVSLLNRSGLVDVPFEEWVEILAAADAYAAERDSYVIASLIPADLERACRWRRRSRMSASAAWSSTSERLTAARPPRDRSRRSTTPAGRL